MFVLDDRFPMDEAQTAVLPNDLMNTPIQGNKELNICHSDSTGKWYVLRNLPEPLKINGQEVFSSLIDSGKWVDIAKFYFEPYFAYAPFHWGETYKNHRYPDRVQYIPIWQSIPTGKYDDEGLPLMKEDYKILVIMPYSAPFQSDNPVQYNLDTRFDFMEYGEDLIRLVEELELFTGLKF